jgi:hypothetical protein
MDSVSEPGTPPHQIRGREDPPPELLVSSAAAHLRRNRHALVAELYTRRGTFWSLVNELRERRNVTPSVAVPRRQTLSEGLLLPEGGPEFPGRPDQPPDDEEQADQWWEQEEELDAFRESWLPAKPTAIGTAGKLSSAAYDRRSNHNGEPAANQASDGKMAEVTMAIRYSRPTTEAAKAIHLICSRSSPLERR